jgi:hypothetical protein
MELKAHGHPGILLYRADADQYLCESCTYHLDDTCTFPQRPQAKDCTLYRDQAQATQAFIYRPARASSLKVWLSRNGLWLVLLGLVCVSVAIALLG